jgi:phosphatidylserine synthase
VVVAGAWRLSRFPLVQEQGHFVGLPTPAAGVTIMLLVLATPSVAALVGAGVLSGSW